MKTTIIFFLAILSGLSLLSKNTLDYFNSPRIDPNPKGFAVIELFTSEGCSSCPPADKLIAKLQKESDGKPVYILAYHVDYWNRLGWKDAFSDHAYSVRQEKYAKWLNVQSVYTPEAIINGREELVGSEEGTLRKFVNNHLGKISSTNLTLSASKDEMGNVGLQYKFDGLKDDNSLIIALVQKNAVSVIKNGENKGRTLSHVQIVRNMITKNIGHKNEGSESINIPEALKTQHLEVIALIQNNETGEISGAARSGLN
jgi:hypothetical protein